MLGRKVVFGLVACALAAVLAVQSMSGAAQGGRQRGARQDAGAQRPQGRQSQGLDREQMQTMMTERMKERLDVDDTAWKVFEPRLRKVMELSRQANASGRRGTSFGRTGRQGRGQDRGTDRPQTATTDRELSATEKAAQGLRELLESEAASADQIKARLVAYRRARDKAAKDLADAQKQLKQICSVKQEAMLVLMGTLP